MIKEIDVAKIESVTLVGISGAQYSFDVCPLMTSFTATGAAYGVTKRTKEGQVFHHQVIYIGQTGDLSTRFYDHHKEEYFGTRLADCICIPVDGNKTSRLVKELDPTQRYKPPVKDSNSRNTIFGLRWLR